MIKYLLDKKSSVHSHRPASYVRHTIAHGDHLLLMQYGDDWRSVRKQIHQYFMEAVYEKHHIRLVNAEAVQMLRDFLVAPWHHMKHPKRFSNNITNSLGLYTVMEAWTRILEYGATPRLDSFPLFHMIPERWLRRLMSGPYHEVVGRVQERHRGEGGVNRCSFMDRVLEQKYQGKLGFLADRLSFLGGVLMEGGSDISSSLIIDMRWAMVEYPDVQMRAQEEIYAIIGEDRSPT